MSRQIGNHTRQWVALAGGSCDLRVGHGVLEEAAPILKGAVGQPRLAALVVGVGSDDAVVELLERQLADAGFGLKTIDGTPTRTLAGIGALAARLAKVSITSDDLIVVVGDTDELSACAYVAGSWQGGTSLAVVPTSVEAAVMGIVSPRGIDVDASKEALAVRGCARHALCDLSSMSDVATGGSAFARALMAATAMGESERAFGALWDRAQAITEGDADAVKAQLVATVKGGGQVISSTSAAIRAAGSYGMTFARALLRLAPSLDAGVALADGLRFCARLSAGMGTCTVDDVLAQDELLERLGMGLASCDVDATALVDALRAERFARTNRFMLELPRTLGKVRLATIDEDLLAEHAQAWCEARRRAF